MARRRYGTPLPPGMRVTRFHLPRLPRTSAGVKALLRDARTWLRLGIAIGIMGVLTASVGTLTTPPPRPVYDLQGERVILRSISFRRPLGWAMAIDDPSLKKPLVLFAPQRDTTAPPVTITLYQVDITDRYLADVGNSPIGVDGYDLLARLVDEWVNDAAMAKPDLEEPWSYNTADGSGIASIALHARWDQGIVWRPLLGQPTATASAHASPTASPAGATPKPSATPYTYPTLGEPRAEQLYQEQAFYLPQSGDFLVRDRDGNITRAALVASLTYPTTTAPDVREEIVAAFRLFAESISLN